MISIPITISLNQLWGAKTFSKSEWGEINVIVGPNGTGKSLFAEKLKEVIQGKGIKTRLLNAERLAGFERMNYDYFSGSGFVPGIDIANSALLKQKGEAFGLSTSAFLILKERLDIKIKIEALLSDMFHKTIRLVEEGGFLKPRVQNMNGGEEYSLKEQECHGLKELLTLLTFLYDNTIQCLIFDEPELHLHPQFQAFFLNEIRKVAGNPLTDPTQKLIFIITHSPYFLDLRSIEDLKSLLVCHYNDVPTYIYELELQDEIVLKKFLPRFNTHHKQFFFSPNPVFVEGYIDQQIFTLLLDKLNYNIGASGSCVIDVGGKDELAVFFKICVKLKLNAKIIADLDGFFKGRIRRVAQVDDRCITYVQDKGLGIDFSREIGEFETDLKQIADDIAAKTSSDADIQALITFLKPIVNIADKKTDVVCSVLMAIQQTRQKVLEEVTPNLKPKINYLLAKFNNLLEAFESANVYILPKGEIEHYYTQSLTKYLNIENKADLFHTERDYILSVTNPEELKGNYSQLLEILFKAVPAVKVDLTKHIQFQLSDWIQLIQSAIMRGEVRDESTFKTSAKVNYALYSQIIELKHIDVQPNDKFTCTVSLKETLIKPACEFTFDETTTAFSFRLPKLAPVISIG